MIFEEFLPTSIFRNRRKNTWHPPPKPQPMPTIGCFVFATCVGEIQCMYCKTKDISMFLASFEGQLQKQTVFHGSSVCNRQCFSDMRPSLTQSLADWDLQNMTYSDIFLSNIMQSNNSSCACAFLTIHYVLSSRQPLAMIVCPFGSPAFTAKNMCHVPTTACVHQGTRNVGSWAA